MERSVGGGQPQWRTYVAIACVAAAMLVYQVAITRVLSVVLWYHFAFLSVSLAMLGIGVPGVWYSLRPPRPGSLGAALVASGIAVPASVAVIFRFGGSLTRGAHLDGGVTSLFPSAVLLVVAAIVAATLAMGSAICVLLIEARGRELGRVYGADLFGATLGAAVVVPLMHVVPTPLLIAGCGLLPLAAAVARDAAPRWVAPAAGALLIGSMAWGAPYELHWVKGYSEDRSEMLHEQWTPTARITVWKRPFFLRNPDASFGWGMGSNFQPRPLRQLWIEQDGAAGTPITQLTGDPAELDHLFFDVTALGYELRPPRRVCVIGAGGGRDVLTALAGGATAVDAVELNGAIIDLVSGPFGELSGDIYHRPGVTAIASEGRAFLTRTDHRYDLLQISLIDSWAATAAGAFALSENHLYTLEAFRLYYDRLTPDGILSVSRWAHGRRYLEASRLVLLAVAALEADGVADPRRHIVVMSGGALATLLVSRRAFEADELAAADEIAARRGFQRHWPPPHGGDRPSLITAVLVAGGGPLTQLGADMSPPTDDRPFFFQTVPLIGSVDPALLRATHVNEHAVILLRWLLAIIAAVALALFLAPFAIARVRPRSAELWRGSGYFAAIGIGFMLVEAGWIQRFILFLGHPSYSTTVVIAALLLGASAGSLLSARTELARLQRLAPALPLALLAINYALAPVFELALGSALAVRIAVAAAALLPAGFLLGFAFPCGMLRFGDDGKAWFWAINGVTSVLATVFSLALAMVVGFTQTVTLGCVCYLAAALLIRPASPETSAEAPVP